MWNPCISPRSHVFFLKLPCLLHFMSHTGSTTIGTTTFAIRGTLGGDIHVRAAWSCCSISPFHFFSDWLFFPVLGCFYWLWRMCSLCWLVSVVVTWKVKGKWIFVFGFWFCIVLIDGRVREREKEDEGWRWTIEFCGWREVKGRWRCWKKGLMLREDEDGGWCWVLTRVGFMKRKTM